MPAGAINYSVTEWAIPSGDPLELGSSLGQFPPAPLESVDSASTPKDYLIATGGAPLVPDLPGLADERQVNDSLLESSGR